MSLQQTITRIAAELGRPALVEDHRRSVVAYSPHPDEIDEVRRRSILEHRADPAVHSWLSRLGVYAATSAVRVPGNPELGMLPRICVPIGRSGIVFGHLWFIEPVEPAGRETPLDLARASASAELVAEEWARVRMSLEGESAREDELARELMLGRAEVRRAAAAELVESGRFESGLLRAYVLSPGAPASSRGPAAEPLERAARRARQALGGRGVLALARRDHAVVVVPSATGRFTDTDRIAGVVAESAAEAFGANTVAPRVAVGGEASVVAARESYREARRALGIAASFRLAPRVLHWDRLGVYRGLDSAAAAGLRSGDFQPGLERLAAERDGDVLIDTLTSYLAAAGHVQTAAARLGVHRTSLYNRLNRAQRILGIDLDDGLDRLGVHISLLLRAGEATSDDGDPTAR
ncbi:DNA-binding transcriptional regulator, PucR family [Agromyces cerinus subsp. cerinus]|uniref:DNA-binding transcriptional regulator, PucR family n=2 Tax=Agromyces cerinus TaxID=33878 RepID=A0A1N6ID78_9MICO|nr:DNA-binding transcriptional regulator, PucR family [Agromyces cerinus subsp. cerinus]